MTPKQRLAALEKHVGTTKTGRYSTEEEARRQRMGRSTNPADSRKPAEIRHLSLIFGGHRTPEMTDDDVQWVADVKQWIEDQC